MIGLAINALIPGAYPLVLPQDIESGITYQLITEERYHAMGADTPVVRARVQIDAWADSYPEAQTLAETVRAISRHRGTAGGIVVQDVLHDSSIELHDDGYRVSQEFSIFYEV